MSSPNILSLSCPGTSVMKLPDLLISKKEISSQLPTLKTDISKSKVHHDKSVISDAQTMPSYLLYLGHLTFFGGM